jgi:Relaxase/Mobilisation nuclease domain
VIPNITRGGAMGGVIEYLAGPGNANEHENPTLVAASLGIAAEAGFKTPKLEDRSMQRALAAALDAPRIAWGREVRKRNQTSGEMEAAHVWHCSLTLAPGEKLTEAEWNRVGRQFVAAMKFDKCEWALVKHGATGTDKLDHAHLVVNLVQTETGKPAGVHNDFKRAQAACAKIAREHCLTELSGQQRHLPETDRREIEARKLTQGFRYEIAKRVLEQLDGDISDDRRVAAVGLKYIPSKRGGALALLERRDVAIPASDLQARINEHMAALELERSHGEPRLTPARHQSEQDYEDDHWAQGRDTDPGHDGGSER